jgi:hypothetical protein
LEETSVGEIVARLAVKQCHGFAGVIEHVPKANEVTMPRHSASPRPAIPRFGSTGSRSLRC